VIGLDETFDVFGQHIHFEIDATALGSMSESGDVGSVRDDRDTKRVLGDVEGGEADPIDRDRSLFHQIAHQVSGDPNDQIGSGIDDFAHCVDVSENHVSSETVSESHGSLEVHAIALLKRPDRGPIESFGADIGFPPGFGLGPTGVDQGQAAPIDRN
jgi:hypothetical protein